MMEKSERAIVLMYHGIGDGDGDRHDSRYCVSPERFAAHMSLLAEKGYRACDIDGFVGWLGGTVDLPHGAFLLTFDDGFLGVYEHARPVLARLGWPATVFLVSGLIGERDVWKKREDPAAKSHPLMDRRHIRQMAREDFSFQSHSRTHADLTSLPEEELATELAGARRDLEELLGKAAPYLAYPYGRYDERVRDATIAAGYRAAFSVQPGFNRPGVDPYGIRRLDVFGTDTPAALLRKMAFGANDGSLIAATRYYLSSRRWQFARRTQA